jgi:hypothetical protein
MSGVTWGNNTVHTFGAAPAPATFGAPAPAFGAPAPAPAFGAPAPAFGAPAPAPATGGFGFGAAPSPAKPSLFGTPAPAVGGFGAQQQPQVPQHHIPAQAAIQASVGGPE